MASSIYFPVPRRPNGHHNLKSRASNGLPIHSSAVQEKLHRHRDPHSLSWIIPVSLAIPGLQNRRLRVLVPNPNRLHQLSVSRFGRKRGRLLLCFAFLIMIFTTFALAKRFGTEEKKWPAPFTDPPTLVFKREDLQRIWQWEISSGHYPSRRASK